MLLSGRVDLGDEAASSLPNKIGEVDGDRRLNTHRIQGWYIYLLITWIGCFHDELGQHNHANPTDAMG